MLAKTICDAVFVVVSSPEPIPRIFAAFGLLGAFATFAVLSSVLVLGIGWILERIAK